MNAVHFGQLDQPAYTLIGARFINKQFFDAFRILPQPAGNSMETKYKSGIGHYSDATHCDTKHYGLKNQIIETVTNDHVAPPKATVL